MGLGEGGRKRAAAMWYLVGLPSYKNRREHLQQYLDRKRACLPIVSDIPLKETKARCTACVDPPDDGPPGEALVASSGSAHAGDSEESLNVLQQEQPVSLIEQEGEISSLTYGERKKKISRDKRYARYEEVMALYRAGLGQRAITRRLRISRKVVRRFVSSPAFPERAEGTGQRASGTNKLARYLPYLREQWTSGVQNGSRLFREIKARGYKGSRSLLGHLIAEWRTELPPKPSQGKPRKPRLAAQRPGQRRLSSRSASFLMILPSEKQTPVQQQQIEHICQASEELRTVYLLSQEFMLLLKERQAEALDGWLKRVKESHVTELLSFVNGIARDYAAVRAAFSLPWSNGIVEGHVNRLKFLKRQMFGRARLDLLRVKVLHAV